jgi:hypothetical protein
MCNEYKSLLPYGIHERSAFEINDLCVNYFSNNSKRKYLFDNLMNNLVNPLVNLEIDCDLWIDGSFLTEKPEPNDIDIAIALKTSSFNPDQLQFLNKFTSCQLHTIFKKSYDLDVYFIYNGMQNYWFELFSHDRNKNQKGFVLLNLEGGS